MSLLSIPKSCSKFGRVLNVFFVSLFKHDRCVVNEDGLWVNFISSVPNSSSPCQLNTFNHLMFYNNLVHQWSQFNDFVPHCVPGLLDVGVRGYQTNLSLAEQHMKICHLRCQPGLERSLVPFCLQGNMIVGYRTKLVQTSRVGRY